MDTTYEYNGVQDRSVLEKTRDYRWEELYAHGSVEFKERAPVGYTPRNQAGTSSCVTQTQAKMTEVWDFKYDNTLTVYSAAPTYATRPNKPGLGTDYAHGLGWSIKNGSFLESDVISQNITEDQINNTAIPVSNQLIRPTNYLVMPIDFYAVASEIDHTGAVMVWIKSSFQEWCRDVPMGNSNSQAVSHSVTAVDKIAWKGTEYIIIEDSWGKWDNTSDIPLLPGQRAITRDFYQNHCFFSGCYTAFSFTGEIKPKFMWTVPMKYGQTSQDIVKWQNMLKYEKFFPNNKKATGYFGGLTARATVAWQKSHGIMDFATETNMTKIVAGPKSIAKANSIYSK